MYKYRALYSYYIFRLNYLFGIVCRSVGRFLSSGMSDFDETEDKWWIENPKKYPSFDELPAKTKWLARIVLDDSPQSHTHLEVCVDHQKHLLPEKYIAQLMLLNIQELSCMAESFSLTVIPPQDTRLWRNIHFIWNLRESILEKEEEKRNKCTILLQRWTIRLIHGITNSKSRRRDHAEQIGRLYSAYLEEGSLEQGRFFECV
jgi:hypothetical protein